MKTIPSLRFAMLSLLLACQALAVSPACAWEPPAGPRQTVVLLSSLDTSQIRLPWELFFMRHYFRTYEAGIESVFNSYFAGRGYDVEIHALSDQHDLWEALHSPRDVAVIWLSHAAFSGLTGPGVGGGGEIADSGGFDITDVFQEVHPNLRFLGVVGCKSEQVLRKQLEDHGVLRDNPMLQFKAFERKIDAKKGLKIVSSQALAAISDPETAEGYQSPCLTREGFPLVATRRLPEAPGEGADPRYPAARLETSGGTVLGVFPAGRPGEEQVLRTHIDVVAGTPLAPFSLNLIEDAGANPAASDSLVQIGDLSLSAPWPGAAWRVFTKPDGTVIGVTSHVYTYVGPSVIRARPRTYEPYACEAMAPHAFR